MQPDDPANPAVAPPTVVRAMLKSVCVVGLGYIGLPTASFLATKGYRVYGVDVSQKVVDTINEGRIHIKEPGLDILVKSAVQSSNLTAATEPRPADVFIIAVPTPFRDGHQPDLSHIEAACEAIAPHLRPGNLVILESTSPVGTTERMVAPRLAGAGLVMGEDLFLAHCPERVLPGRILAELVENDRIVGGVDEVSTEVAADFYAEFVNGEVLRTDAATAEMSKLAENSFRDVNIAFANELSMLCDKEGVNVWNMIGLANRHPRVNVLSPGPGVGGHCIAVDPWFLIANAGNEAKLIRAAREVNDAKPGWVFDKIKASASKFKEPVIACLGLAFKADVDDLRQSPAVGIAERLMAENIGRVIVCEPNLESHPRFALTGLDEAVAMADIVVVLVDHRPFRALRSVDLIEKVVIDTRGVIR